MNALCSFLQSGIDSFNDERTGSAESSIDPIIWMRDKALAQLKSDAAFDLIHKNPNYTEEALEEFVDNPSFIPNMNVNLKAPNIIAAFNTWIRDRTAQSDGSTAATLDEYAKTAMSALENEMQTGWLDTILNKSEPENIIVPVTTDQSMSKASSQLPPPEKFESMKSSEGNVDPLPVVPPIRSSVNDAAESTDDDTESIISNDDDSSDDE